jgi:hypothetical protein
MEKTETKRKLRDDLTPEEREKADRIGCLSFSSPRNPFRYRSHESFKFIPSKEQH